MKTKSSNQYEKSFIRMMKAMDLFCGSGSFLWFSPDAFENLPFLSPIVTDPFKNRNKPGFLQDPFGCRIFAEADPVNLIDPDELCHDRQKCPDSLRGISVTGVLFRDVITDLPDPIIKRNQLDITDIYVSVPAEYGIYQRSAGPAVL